MTLPVSLSRHAVPGEPNVTYTRPGSTTGVGEAALLNGWTYCGFSTSNSLMSWTIFPVSRSTQTTPSCRPSGVAVVTQTCLPSTTGLDHALPWIGLFHATFSPSLHSTGSAFA